MIMTFLQREWISPAAMLWVIAELVTNSATYKPILDHFDIHILPVANPDGYEYTHTDERNWRKTRKPNSGSPCIGTDPNRNFNYHWNGMYLCTVYEEN